MSEKRAEEPKTPYFWGFPEKRGIFFSCPRVLAVRVVCRGLSLNGVYQLVTVPSPDIFDGTGAREFSETSP